jgi:hypothetical protein
MATLPPSPAPGPVYALGFSRWKHAAVRAVLTGYPLHFVNHAAQLPHGATVAVWGLPPETLAARDDLNVLRLEDGFLRSVGLGAELTTPLSWVVDRRGLYYDATTPSDLEVLLQQSAFNPAEIARAAQFRASVVAAGVTKYNLGGVLWQRPAGVRRVILLVGQVESDASLRYGAPQVKTNLALAEAVRAEAPDDYLLYKPHPDVVSRLRASGVAEDRVSTVVDATVLDADTYLIACSCLIEYQPVAAGLVSEPASYPWSSYAHHIGLRKDPLITDHSGYWALGNTPFDREAAYQRRCELPPPVDLGKTIEAATLKAWALGSDAFKQQLEKLTLRRLHPAKRGRPAAAARTNAAKPRAKKTAPPAG